MFIFLLIRVVQHLLRKGLTLLGVLDFIFYTEEMGKCFLGFEKNKGSTSLELLCMHRCFMYVSFLVIAT